MHRHDERTGEHGCRLAVFKMAVAEHQRAVDGEPERHITGAPHESAMERGAGVDPRAIHHYEIRCGDTGTHETAHGAVGESARALHAGAVGNLHVGYGAAINHPSSAAHAGTAAAMTRRLGTLHLVEPFLKHDVVTIECTQIGHGGSQGSGNHHLSAAGLVDDAHLDVVAETAVAGARQ